ncbi:MAG: Mov34/MPN/PAD-1 family protein [Parcubacteria group bacterium]|nr:Mov34/MPN/PAD-1 family protein [Parcubacteria group bacterium]
MLQPESPRFTFLLPKIPKPLVKEMARFFATISSEYGTEAIILLLWNKDEKIYTLLVPRQLVSPDNISQYDIPRLEYPISLVGTFHSHARRPAFHSAIDCHDEKSMDGIHGTFGSFRDSDNVFSVSIHAVVNGTRFSYDPIELLEGITPLSQEKPEYALLDTEKNIFPKDYSIPAAWYENIHATSLRSPLHCHKKRRGRKRCG